MKKFLKIRIHPKNLLVSFYWIFKKSLGLYTFLKRKMISKKYRLGQNPTCTYKVAMCNMQYMTFKCNKETHFPIHFLIFAYLFIWSCHPKAKKRCLLSPYRTVCAYEWWFIFSPESIHVLHMHGRFPLKYIAN